MVAFGYSMLCEQRGPHELVADAVGAEEAGFDLAVISDHYFPWLAAQGHSPNAWPVLGAAAAATERMPLMTYVTCPTLRYHHSAKLWTFPTPGCRSRSRSRGSSRSPGSRRWP